MKPATVLVRVSFNGTIGHAAVPLILRLAEAGLRVAVIAGLGDPRGDINPALSLARFVPLLEEMTGTSVTFIPESVGGGAEAGLARVPAGGIALMENLRFHPDERRREKVFAMRLSALGDCFVDAGDPPVNRDGWQAELKRILPEPALRAHCQFTREEA